MSIRIFKAKKPKPGDDQVVEAHMSKPHLTLITEVPHATRTVRWLATKRAIHAIQNSSDLDTATKNMHASIVANLLGVQKELRRDKYLKWLHRLTFRIGGPRWVMGMMAHFGYMHLGAIPFGNVFRSVRYTHEQNADRDRRIRHIIRRVGDFQEFTKCAIDPNHHVMMHKTLGEDIGELAEILAEEDMFTLESTRSPLGDKRDEPLNVKALYLVIDNPKTLSETTKESIRQSIGNAPEDLRPILAKMLIGIISKNNPDLTSQVEAFIETEKLTHASIASDSPGMTVAGVEIVH